MNTPTLALPQARTFASQPRHRGVATDTRRLASLRPGTRFACNGYKGLVMGPGPNGGILVELRTSAGNGGWVEHEWHGKVNVTPERT